MIHKADVAYLALGDYRNGACSWRTGQFVLITEPELAAALEAEGAMDLLQRLDREAFLGQGAGEASVDLLPPVAMNEDASHSEIAAHTASAAAEAGQDETDAAPVPEARAAEADEAEGITVAAGKQRGRNRMRTGGQDR